MYFFFYLTISLISFQRGQFFSCHIYFLKIQCFLWIILVPSPRLISLSIPLLLPLLRRALKQLGTKKSLHIIAFLHFSALWVLIKLGNHGKPAYLKQPIPSPHPAVSSTYQPHSIKLSVSEGDLITPFPSPELIRFLYSAGLYLAHSSSLWLCLAHPLRSHK